MVTINPFEKEHNIKFIIVIIDNRIGLRKSFTLIKMRRGKVAKKTRRINDKMKKDFLDI